MRGVKNCTNLSHIMRCSAVNDMNPLAVLFMFVIIAMFVISRK